MRFVSEGFQRASRHPGRYEVLRDAGRVTREAAKGRVETEYENSRLVEDQASEFEKALKQIASLGENRKGENR